jgi:chromosome condensin MukBEF MukE localization factor
MFFKKKKSEQELLNELQKIQREKKSYNARQAKRNKLSSLQRQIKEEKSTLFNRKAKNSGLGKAVRSKTAKRIGRTVLDIGRQLNEGAKNAQAQQNKPKKKKSNDYNSFMGF